MISKSSNLSWSTKDLNVTNYYIISCLLISLIVFIDYSSPMGIAVGTMYVIVVLFTFWHPKLRSTYFAASISTILIIGMYLYKPPIDEAWKAIVNRFISLTITWIIAILTVKIKRSDQKLIEMASYDFMTGLLNRREMFSRLNIEYSHVKRRGVPLSIIVLDVDHFKNINDTYGHTIGDVVLRAIAHILREGVREYDIICRYGGEEFIVITPETAIQQAHELAERLVKQVSISPIKVEAASSITITISAGVTQLLEGDSIEMLISRADRALYHSKEKGRNQVTIL